MKILSQIWTKLAEKGKLGTILGSTLGGMTNIKLVHELYTEQWLSTIAMQSFILAYAVSVTFLILPSVLRITSKLFNLEIED